MQDTDFPLSLRSVHIQKKTRNSGKKQSRFSLVNITSQSGDKYDLVFIENSISDINNLAEEIIIEKNKKRIIHEDDEKIRDEFWKIYFKTTGKEKIRNHLPKISPSFLRNNIDLLN